MHATDCSTRPPVLTSWALPLSVKWGINIACPAQVDGLGVDVEGRTASDPGASHDLDASAVLYSRYLEHSFVVYRTCNTTAALPPLELVSRAMMQSPSKVLP